ncbi:MAG: DUF2490 domain-containing protein [Rikenellaceae bacterium]
MRKIEIKKIILSTLLLLSMAGAASASGTKDDPEVLYKYQIGAELKFKLAKGLKLDVGPELRFYEGYDKLLLNAGLTYKAFDCIYVGASYRLVVDREESASSEINYSVFGGYNSKSYDSQTYHRYAFDVTYKDKFGRFTPSFRVRYNNYADDEIDDKKYLRYRAKVEYDIRKCKITPFISAEGYQELEDNMLHKMRYSTGFDLKSGDNSAISFEYKLDYFNLKYKNTNIFSLGYKYKF